ncbi:hypothetical protein [Bacillus suaedaesalsae]|uniref:Uncharacterized protein n=1 Tax=Bacillus suaedaesalsae TaxID=2810349 RepID=A0ABS2DI91_9BACI|nr:hypothetical protein [Bacillus suaedaesalsae]MBM6618204.1 hypothetical protein [Bacillus suaedaesalsae]
MKQMKICPSCGYTVDLDTIHFSSCCEQGNQPTFPSENSTFSPEALAEIKECIEQANELLLSIGLDNEEDEINLRSFQLSMRKIKGQFITISVTCNEESLKVKGVLSEVGLDFIILETNVENLLLIQTERLVFIEHHDDSNQNSCSDQELLCIDDELRRNLMLCFSEVVSRSPYLLNLFFGLKLNLYLESFLGSVIYVKSDNEKSEIEGTLTKVDNRKIELKNNDNEKQGIDFDELCYIEIEMQKLAGMSLFRA